MMIWKSKKQTLDEMRKVGFYLSNIRNKDRTVGKYQPRSSTTSYSKRNKLRQSYKQVQHTYSPQAGKDNSFFIEMGPAFTQSVGHEEVSQEVRRPQTMMDQSCLSVNLRILKNKPKLFSSRQNITIL